MQNQFHNLSLHKQISFLNEFHQRVKALVYRKKDRFLGYEGADDTELINNNSFCYALAFAQDPNNQPQMNQVYQKLNPANPIFIPDNLDFQSIIIMVHTQLFSQYYPQVSNGRLFKLAKLVLTHLSVTTIFENEKLDDIIEFSTVGPTITFSFLDKTIRCVLNRNTPIGFNMTILNDKMRPF